MFHKLHVLGMNHDFWDRIRVVWGTGYPASQRHGSVGYIFHKMVLDTQSDLELDLYFVLIHISHTRSG